MNWSNWAKKAKFQLLIANNWDKKCRYTCMSSRQQLIKKKSQKGLPFNQHLIIYYFFLTFFHLFISYFA
jgi:hypothetical protein